MTLQTSMLVEGLGTPELVMIVLVLFLLVGLPAILIVVALLIFKRSKKKSDEGMKKCAFCAYSIPVEATVCRFCGRELPQWPE